MGPEAQLRRDTWGISDRVLLSGYAVSILGTFAGMSCAQRRIWGSSSPSRIDFEDLDPCEVGLLRSRELAVTVAFLDLESRGAVVLDPSLAGEAPLAARIEWMPPHQPRCRIELAIHEALLDLAATRPGERHSPRDVAMGASSLLGRAEQALAVKGLRPSPEVVRRLRCTLFWLIPVLGLGTVRLWCGLARGQPVGFLALVLAVVTGYALSHRRAGSWTPPAVTAARRRWRAPKARKQRRCLVHDALSPIEVAVDGTRALGEVAPGLAARRGAPRPDRGLDRLKPAWSGAARA